MNTRLANPAPFGIAGFSFALWMFCMIKAGWFGTDSMGLVLAVAFTFGGSALLIAGIMEYFRGNTFGTVMFLSYSALWWSFALYKDFFFSKVPEAFMGWYLLVWGVFTLYMWIASFGSTRSMQFFLLALAVTFGLLALGSWGLDGLSYIGGYTGLLTGVLGFYLSATEVIKATTADQVKELSQPIDTSEIHA